MQALPLGCALWIGRRLGEIAFWLNPGNRRKVYQHMRIAFGADRPAGKITALVWELYRNYGQNIIEIARLSRYAACGLDEQVDIQGREHVDRLLLQGRGLIFLSIHSGNWELSNMAGSMRGHPYNMVANYLDHVNKVADLLDSWRKSGGCKIINPGIGGREIIKALKRNEIVTLVADQGGSDGLLLPFFGREASMSTGAVRIALKYGVPICLVDIARVGGAKHRLRVLPFELTATKVVERDVHDNMLRIVAHFEAWTREHPAEYLWFYKTWKYARDRRILILDDGRTGHLRQSEALARQVSSAFKERGLKAILNTVTIEWRSGLAPLILGACSLLRFLGGGLGLLALKPFLTAESYALLCSLKPDVVISCGNKNAWVNVWAAADNGARNICILRPGALGPGQNEFDLLVMPGHDVKGRVPANVVVTKVAPNLVDQSYLDDNVRGLTSRFSHLKLHGRSRIGLLIGGDTKGLVLGEQQVRVVIHQLKEAAQKYSADILVTTSRRTSPAVEALVAREFNDFSSTALIILASRNNVPEAVGGILGLCDLVVVSGESVSMLSEAASSGKKVIVFPVDGPDRKPLINKYSAFAEMLSAGGHVVYARTTQVADAVDRLLRDKVRTISLEDNATLLEAARKIVR
ncbi:MAG: mitochondrial fission ELM1 family protein [Candidatus Omnitrophica bacterium]|nr:mitochondrial fission ELM1 family protein [Candidatus Omnitrophota bacterium]